MRTNFLIGALMLTIVVGHGVATAQTISFTRVADTETPVPGGTGTFDNFGSSPSVGGGDVAFVGDSQGFTLSGVYLYDGATFDVVADTTTSVPGGTTTFVQVAGPSVSAGNVAFHGISRTGSNGIYIDVGGMLDVVADETTLVPGRAGTFFGFGTPSISGDDVVFLGFPQQTTGSASRVYIDDGTTLDVVADQSTPAPAGIGSFDDFLSPSVSGSDVAFRGLSQEFTSGGIYIDVGGTLDVVADTITSVPDGTGTFDGFVTPSVSSSDVAFRGFSQEFASGGIYLYVGGDLLKVIQIGDELDGKEVSFVSMGSEALSGDRLAFFARFLSPPGSEGIFLATVPEPSREALQVAAVGVLILLTGRARRRRVRSPLTLGPR